MIRLLSAITLTAFAIVILPTTVLSQDSTSTKSEKKKSKFSIQFNAGVYLPGGGMNLTMEKAPSSTAALSSEEEALAVYSKYYDGLEVHYANSISASLDFEALNNEDLILNITLIDVSLTYIRMFHPGFEHYGEYMAHGLKSYRPEEYLFRPAVGFNIEKKLKSQPKFRPYFTVLLGGMPTYLGSFGNPSGVVILDKNKPYQTTNASDWESTSNSNEFKRFNSSYIQSNIGLGVRVKQIGIGLTYNYTRAKAKTDEFVGTTYKLGLIGLALKYRL